MKKVYTVWLGPSTSSSPYCYAIGALASYTETARIEFDSGVGTPILKVDDASQPNIEDTETVLWTLARAGNVDVGSTEVRLSYTYHYDSEGAAIASTETHLYGL